MPTNKKPGTIICAIPATPELSHRTTPSQGYFLKKVCDTMHQSNFSKASEKNLFALKSEYIQIVL